MHMCRCVILSIRMLGNFLMCKRREDDELAIIEALYANDRSSANHTRIHTSILTGDRYVREVLEGHELRCKRDFRMEQYIFRNLVQCLRERCHLRDTNFVSVEEQVGIFLYAVSKNATNHTLQGQFQHSGEVISRYFHIVLNALMILSGRIKQLPPINVPLKVARNTKFMPYLKVLFTF